MHVGRVLDSPSVPFRLRSGPFMLRTLKGAPPSLFRNQEAQAGVPVPQNSRAQERAAAVHDIHLTDKLLVGEEVRRSSAASLRLGSFLDP